MAEGDQKADPYLQGSFKIGKILHDVSLSSSNFSWTKKGDAVQKAVSVPIEELVSVKKCNTTEPSSFTVCYVSHKKKDILRRDVVTFQGEAEAINEWCQKLQAAIDQVKERPHKLLVLVNPVSGSSKGKKVYFDIVAEVFKEANIETDVIITEKSKHSVEILSSYNLATIDGVVIVGGDGFYNEAVNGLQRRLMKEAGVNENNSSSDLEPMNLPIGVIPAGTGNATAHRCYGTNDVETAALNIVIGAKMRNSILGVHSQGELIGYSSLIVGYGFWGDIIYNAETRRHLGVLRYAVSLGDTIIIKPQRHMNLQIEYVAPLMSETKNEESQPIKTVVTDQPIETKESLSEPMKTAVSSEETASEVTKEAEKSKVGVNPEHKEPNRQSLQGVYSGMFVTVFYFKSTSEDSAAPIEEHIRLVLNRPCGRFRMLRYMYNVLSESQSLDNTIVDHKLVKEFQVKLTNPSNPDTNDYMRELVINIDGEICPLKQPEFNVRIHPKIVQLYCNASKIGDSEPC